MKKNEQPNLLGMNCTRHSHTWKPKWKLWRVIVFCYNVANLELLGPLFFFFELYYIAEEAPAQPRLDQVTVRNRILL